MSTYNNRYQKHESVDLCALFARDKIPYQGQTPSKSRILIFGLDANYSSEISSHPQFFKKIIEYHEDGVAFWKKYGVHHPFLLCDYPLKRNTGGVPYHRRFTWLGLNQANAEDVSFVELLPVPTTGRTKPREFWDNFSETHARNLDGIVLSGEPRLVLVSSSLMNNYMKKARKKFNVFPWLPNDFQIGEMKRIQKTIVFGAPHFSSTTYKKTLFESIGNQIKTYLKDEPHN